VTKSAAVAVIGGGVIGASVAFHLARAGMRDIVILDRAAGPGLGSTGRATGGFRAQFETPINVRLSLLSRDKLLTFAEEVGVDPEFEQVGYLWLASTESQLEALRFAQSVQKTEGLEEAVELDPSEIPRLNPVIATNGIIGATFCPTDGYINPLAMLRGYLEASERLGVQVKWQTECLGVSTTSSGSVTHVRTADGDIAVSAVVNAAGPWAAGIAAMAGVRLPVVPLRRQAVFTLPTPVIPGDMPMTIFVDTGFHARVRYGRALLCWPQPENPGEPPELHADDAWIATVMEMARERVPALQDVRVDRSLCYAGLYEMSPDHHAILGPSTEYENFYLANGSSGHGVMHSPAIGEIIADMILGNAPPLDVSSLRPSRFDEGDAIQMPKLL
jgi:sarcosine oxidase subunit beta